MFKQIDYLHYIKLYKLRENTMENILSRTIIKPLSLSIALTISALGVQSITASEFTTQRTVFSDNQGNIAPQLNFPQPETGDIYLAYRANGTGDYYFITKDNGAVTEPAAYDYIENYSGIYPLPEFDALNIPFGQYQLYQVMVINGSSVLDVNNWVGGLGALKSLNYSVGNSAEQDGDWNNDGFHDDDHNKDGFHDDDHDKDGFHDDDHDKDGYHDDDHNKDGFHDDDHDKDGFHDDDKDDDDHRGDDD